MNPNPQTPDELAAAVRGALESLKQRRPVFHSEDDLRHEFGWELHRQGVGKIRVAPLQEGETKCKASGLCADGFVAEAKYTTTKFEQLVNGEKFASAGISSTREPHYGFWESVQRIERLVGGNGLQFGCVVCVANYSPMWRKRNRNPNNWFSDFWMEDEKTYPRHLKLGAGKLANHPWNKRVGVRLRKEHTLKWEEWHNFPDMKDGRFRYVVVEIRP